MTTPSCARLRRFYARAPEIKDLMTKLEARVAELEAGPPLATDANREKLDAIVRSMDDIGERLQRIQADALDS